MHLNTSTARQLRVSAVKPRASLRLQLQGYIYAIFVPLFEGVPAYAIGESL
jgi:hypothetical protein